jgi:hypothetical protein
MKYDGSRMLGYLSCTLTPPTLSPSVVLAQAIFEANIFLYKYPNILKPSHSFTLTGVFRDFSSVVTQMLGYSMQSRGTARTPPQARRLHLSA